MTSREFCYWLQGFFELSSNHALSTTQSECIQSHLAMVFKHEIDPSIGSKEHQVDLSKLHGSGFKGDTLLRC